MKFRFYISALAALIALSGCVTNSGPTDSGGRSMKLIDKGSFSPTDSNFNSFAFIKPGSTFKTEATERDNGRAWIEEITWDGGASVFYVEYLRGTWFSTGTQNRLAETGRISRLANEFNIPASAFVDVSRPAPKMIGWVASHNGCSIGFFGKREKHLTSYRNDRGDIDMIVSFKTCGGLTTSAQTVAEKVGLMEDKDLAGIAGLHASK